MKKTIKTLILFLVLFFILSSVCLASSTSSEDISNNSDVPKTVIQNTNDDIFAGNDEVIFTGYVNGNSFVVGKNVTISGYINGDLFVIASTLTIEDASQISGNIFALTQNMTISGIVTDVYAFVQNFTLSNTGLVGRSLNLSCDTALFEGRVGRDVNLSADTFSFAEGAKNLIDRDFNYSSIQEVTIPDGIISGDVNFSQITTEETTKTTFFDYVSTFFMVILYATIVIILTTHFAPNFVNKATYSIRKNPFKSLLIGILAFILVPLASILLLIPFSGVLAFVTLALIAIYILVISITISILSMAIANYISNKSQKRTNSKFILISILIVALIWLLQQIPIVGLFVSILTIVLGLGIFVHSMFNQKALENE